MQQYNISKTMSRQWDKNPANHQQINSLAENSRNSHLRSNSILNNSKPKTNVKSQGQNINFLLQDLEQSIKIIDEDGSG